MYSACVTKASSSTADRLFESLRDLKTDELKWFYLESPFIILKWLRGDFKDSVDSKHLPITFASTQLKAAVYTEMDALVVLMWHLRHVYPVAPATLYRSLLLPKTVPLPKSKIVKITTKGKQRPLQSWTYLASPKVKNRKQDKANTYELILRLEPQEAKPHVVTDYIQLMQLMTDMKEVGPRLSAYRKKKGLDPKGEDKLWSAGGFWGVVLRELKAFEFEKEVMVYLPKGTSVRCTWRVVE
jgi:hypothetical protein